MPQYLIPGIVAGFVVILGFAFFIWYWLPSRRLKKVFKAVIPGLQALKPSTFQEIPVDPRAVDNLLSHDETLSHLWAEYQETLHEQHSVLDGERRLISIRATVPAEVFFNTQVLVDTPLNTEFFRHLPGILTGIGIIGTFSGLILGLSGFEPTGPAELVKASLGGLMEGVREAFYASAFAIAAAMIITFFEKSALTRRYKEVEQLAQAIDALYEAGAGEEYLARLVKAAEQSEVHAAQLKQSLVDELKQILTDLTQRQIQASQQHSQHMAAEVGKAIQASLQAPLEQIANVVERASGQQGTAVQSMLNDLLASFMAKIEETFGGQMRGLNEMMESSVTSMREMQTEFSKLVSDMRQVGESNANDLSTKLTEIIQTAETKQSEMAKQMNELLTEVRSTVGETQTATKENISTLQNLSITAIEKMNTGAETMYLAASEFTKAGEAVEGALSSATEALDELNGLTKPMQESTRNLAAVANALETVQGTTKEMIESLRAIVEEAKRDAQANQEMVDTLEKAASNLSQAQIQAGQYLDRVNEALEEAFSKFGEGVNRELGKNNAAFQTELGKGTDILKAAFTELAAVISQSQGGR